MCYIRYNFLCIIFKTRFIHITPKLSVRQVKCHLQIKFLTKSYHIIIWSICILILISILWLTVAEHYNKALAFISEPFVPDGRSIQVTDTHIFFEDSTTAGTAPRKLFSIDALTLHHGLILMCSVILAANGIRFFDKTKSIVLLSLLSFCIHVTLI